MASELGSRGTLLLLLAVLLVTSYVAWQVAPLSRRMDALDRDRLETRDRLQRQIETLRDRLERVRASESAPSAAGIARPRGGVAAPIPTIPSESAPAAAPAAIPRAARQDPQTFFASRLLSEDAIIAAWLVDNLPAAEIARRLRHSNAFIVAKGIQIEKQLGAAPDTPPEILSALHAAVERAKPRR